MLYLVIIKQYTISFSNFLQQFQIYFVPNPVPWHIKNAEWNVDQACVHKK